MIRALAFGLTMSLAIHVIAYTAIEPGTQFGASAFGGILIGIAALIATKE